MDFKLKVMSVRAELKRKETYLSEPENIVSSSLSPSDILSVISPNDSLLSVDYVQSKITEFSNNFSSVYRQLILNCSSLEKENLIFLLLTLNKNIKYSLEELGRSLTKREYNFTCGLCDESIRVNPGENIWDSLQTHEHFEELYHNFINKNLEIVKIENDSMPVTPEDEGSFTRDDSAATGNSNTDSGIEHQENEPSTSRSPQQSSEDNFNSFRFNFTPSYDEEIESKIYPHTLMTGIRKYDKVKEYSVQRAGNTKAVCLICDCEINGMRVNKNMLVGHAMGQRHLKAATTPQILEILKFYHEFWLKQEIPIQAHQVFFRTAKIPALYCKLCHGQYRIEHIVPHIYTEGHKKKVLEMYEKRINLYFLINLQVQVYGITQEQVDQRDNDYRLKVAAEMEKSENQNALKKAKKYSDSDTADENGKSVHNIIRSVEHPESSNPLDLLPNRMRGDAKLLKRVSNKNKEVVIECNLCKCKVQNNVAAIKSHIVFSAQHMAIKKDKYKYYCEICNVRIMTEKGWLGHDFVNGRHQSMAESRKKKVTEYECTTCKTVIYGDDLSLNRHYSIGGRRERKEKVVKLPDPVKLLFKSKEHILAEGDKLAGDATDVLRNSLTNDCITKIETVLSEHFDGCKVYPFGSRISGIGNKNSDLDVFVDIGDMYYGAQYQDPPDQVNIIRKSVKAFSKNKEYTHLVQVLTARTPIVKLHHVPTNLDCDLSFKHGLSVENTKFLRFCLELQPIVQPFILLVKKWAEHIGFENVTTYALAILGIFYLQVNGYLLSVTAIREINKKEPKVITGWKTLSYDMPVEDMNKYVKPYPHTLVTLLSEFFAYYGKFDFNSYVACPLLGRVVLRSQFAENNGQNLPKEMDSYVQQLDGEDAEVFRSNSFMCIQDPFDLSHNLTKAANPGTLKKFQTLCNLTVKHFETFK